MKVLLGGEIKTLKAHTYVKILLKLNIVTDLPSSSAKLVPVSVMNQASVRGSLWSLTDDPTQNSCPGDSNQIATSSCRNWKRRWK